MKFQILADSSCDLTADYIKNEQISLGIIPLTIYVGEHEYIDDENIDPKKMLEDMHESKEKTRSACPSPDAWLSKFDNADYTFIVTMTSNLSGTYNSAVVARDMYDKKENVHVFNSFSTGGSMCLIIDKIVEMIEKGAEFEQIVTEVTEFIGTRNLFFILHKFDNLIASGRMSKLTGLVAKTLIIRPVCTASPEGTIDVVCKSIGSLGAYKKMVELSGARCNDFENRKLIISHCDNEEDAEQIKKLMLEKYPFKEVVIRPMRGLCSFYSLEKGIIMCF